jgi:hypothetical protein
LDQGKLVFSDPGIEKEFKRQLDANRALYDSFRAQERELAKRQQEAGRKH